MKQSEKVVVEQVLAEGNFLAEKQADFNEHFIVKANDVLYSLLADIMAFTDMVMVSPHKLSILSKMRMVLSKEYKIKTQRNSSDILILVKYVVRTNRKNAHVYARGLDLAYKMSIESSLSRPYCTKKQLTQSQISKYLRSGEAKSTIQGVSVSFSILFVSTY